MDKIKAKERFMKDAPSFVIFGGFGFLAIFLVVGVLTCFTDNWKLGLYVISLCISAISFLLWTIRRFEKTGGISLGELMKKEREYWDGQIND